MNEAVETGIKLLYEAENVDTAVTVPLRQREAIIVTLGLALAALKYPVLSWETNGIAGKLKELGVEQGFFS